MKMTAFGSVATTSIPQVARLYSKEDLVRASSGHSRCAVAALYHSSLLWGHFAAHTPTFTLSLQRRLRVSNAVSYECVETLFISQRGDPCSVTLLEWMHIDRLKRSSATIHRNVLPGDTSLHSLLLSARCIVHFVCRVVGAEICFQSALSGRKPPLRAAGGQDIPLSSPPPNLVSPSAV